MTISLLLLLGLFAQLSSCFQVNPVVRLTSVPRPHTVICSAKNDKELGVISSKEQSTPPGSTVEKGSNENGAKNELKRRRLNLSWCSRDDCYVEELREKVVGQHNEIKFEHPATGQVAYQWSNENVKKPTPRVLILVKRNDDELLQVAADVVKELSAEDDVNVMLPPDVAAKFSHYYSVDNKKIILFDPKPVPGFGGNHLPIDLTQYSSCSNLDDDEEYDMSDNPDLVCTLGGDGLLMYASSLFSGPCPPILCIAGGSLGFLTPFSRCEMVDAIRISLGLNSAKDNAFRSSSGNERAWLEEPMPKLPARSGGKHIIDPKEDDDKEKKPKVKFGANNQICLSMRMRLECCVINREGIVRARFNVLNEVVVDRGSSPYLAALECFCDDVHLTTVQADGVIFSTPTGSTAYSMAAGGSVVHPAVPAILVTPICPHVLSFRSMVFPDHVVLRCYVPDDARSDAAVAFDGKHRRELHRGDSVQIQMSAYPVPTINRGDHSSDWLTSLKRNFNFNTRARQSPL